MLASRYLCIILAAFSLCLNHVMYCTGSMSEIPGEKAQMQGEGEGEGQIPKLFLVTKCIKLHVDILNELPYIALFYHRATVSDLLRSWIVESASATINKPSYQKFRSKVYFEILQVSYALIIPCILLQLRY